MGLVVSNADGCLLRCHINAKQEIVIVIESDDQYNNAYFVFDSKEDLNSFITITETVFEEFTDIEKENE